MALENSQTNNLGSLGTVDPLETYLNAKTYLAKTLLGQIKSKQTYSRISFRNSTVFVQVTSDVASLFEIC